MSDKIITLYKPIKSVIHTVSCDVLIYKNRKLNDGNIPVRCSRTVMYCLKLCEHNWLRCQSKLKAIFHEDNCLMIMVWQRPLLWKARCYNAGAGVQNTNTGITLGLKAFLLLSWRLLGGTGWRCLQPTGCSKISIHPQGQTEQVFSGSRALLFARWSQPFKVISLSAADVGSSLPGWCCKGTSEPNDYALSP